MAFLISFLRVLLLGLRLWLYLLWSFSLKSIIFRGLWDSPIPSPYPPAMLDSSTSLQWNSTLVFWCNLSHGVKSGNFHFSCYVGHLKSFRLWILLFWIRDARFVFDPFYLWCLKWNITHSKLAIRVCWLNICTNVFRDTLIGYICKAKLMSSNICPVLILEIQDKATMPCWNS